MDTSHYSAVAAGITALLFLTRFLIKSYHLVRPGESVPLPLPPSPPSLPLIGHLHLLKPPRHLSIAALAARHGPLVFLRLGSRPALVVSSPDVAEEILSAKDSTFANRPPTHAGEILAYGSSTMFFAPSGPRLRDLRRMTAAELFSAPRLAAMSDIRAEEVRRMARRMLAGDGEVELKGRLFEAAYNTMSKMVAGRRLYGDDEVARRFREIFEEGLRLVFSFNPRDFFPAVGWADLMGVERRMRRLRPRLDGFLAELVEEQRRKRRGGEEEEERTLIEVMLAMQESDPDMYTDELIKGQIMTLLTGGTDAVAETTEAAMLMLLSHPEVMKKAREEIDANIERGCILNESDISRLPYLYCILKETLRLVPLMQGLPPHSSSEDCVIHGYHIPRGTMVFVNTWGIQRDPKLWDDPMEFEPERFASHNGVRDGFRFVPFGAGRRGCPGESLGIRMVTYTVGFFVQCFDWDPMTADEVDLSGLQGLTLPRSQPVVARYKVRQSMIDALAKI